MSHSDHSKDHVVPPAKVHGDSGVNAVVADVDETATADVEKTEREKHDLPSGRQEEAGMRS